MTPQDPKELTTEERENADKLTPEQAAILAGATRTDSDIAGQMTHDANGNPVEPEQVQAVDPVEENKQLFSMLVAMATPALPFLAECYTPEVIGNIAGAYTAVEQKYGWNVRGMVGPEMALALFALPPTVMAYKLGKQHFAEIRAKREAEEARKLPETALAAATSGAIGG